MLAFFSLCLVSFKHLCCVMGCCTFITIVSSTSPHWYSKPTQPIHVVLVWNPLLHPTSLPQVIVSIRTIIFSILGPNFTPPHSIHPFPQPYPPFAPSLKNPIKPFIKALLANPFSSPKDHLPPIPNHTCYISLKPTKLIVKDSTRL